MNLETTGKDFMAYMDRLYMYGSAMGILGFDASTIAPKGGVMARAKRSGFFSQEMYGMAVAPKMRELLEALEPQAKNLDPITAGMYRMAKKNYDKLTKVPVDMVRRKAEHRSKSQVVWEEAKKNNDYASFAPCLKEMIALSKETAGYYQTDGKPDIYDILLDEYEEGMTTEIYDKFFADLKAVIVPLLKKVTASSKKIDESFLGNFVSKPDQEKISRFIAEKVGFDINRGYIGEAAHPFCMGTHRDDVRITTRYNEKDFLSNFYSILHECGHAIYEQNTGDDIAGTAMSRGVSAGLHESQSRFYENIIGRSLPFWQYITDELKTYLPAKFANISPKAFYEAANIAQPSFIRVEADELTYSLHVMVRYEVERMMFTEDIDVMELPALWNKKYEEYLGITPPSDSRGILQDMHWSGGMFGYFPTYSLGSAYAAQFTAYMRREMDVDGLIAKGDFGALTKWLTDKIHRHGSIFTPNDLMNKISSEQLDAKYYTEYLKTKFESLYEL